MVTTEQRGELQPGSNSKESVSVVLQLKEQLLA
jgi:hypothetical protein